MSRGRSFKQTTKILASAASIMVLVEASYAQDSNEPTVLDRIVIFGERQEKPLLETSSSVTILDEEDIDRETGQRISEAIDSAPNVHVRSISETPNIRGVEGGGPGGLANTGLAGTQPRVPIIVDEIARPATIANSDFSSTWDVERIEVFKGPQTTLRGRSAIGGAIVVKTKDPTFDPEAALQVITKFDEFHGTTYTLNGMASGVVIEDRLAVRGTAEFQAGDDPRNITNVPPGLESDAEKLTEFDELRLRGKALFTPLGQDGPVRILGLIDYQTGTTPQTRATVAMPFETRGIGFTTGGLRLFDTEAYTAAVDATFEMSDGGELRSISSFSDSSFESRSEQPNNFFFDFNEDIFNQDILYTLGNPDDAFGGLIGATYSRRSQNIIIDNVFLPLLPPGVNQLLADGTEETYSLFADLRYNFADRWDVLFGGRVLHENEERTTFSDLTAGPPIFVPPVTQVFSESETVVLPFIGLQYEIDPERTFSVTAREGFNSGGAAVNFFSGMPYTFESERVWTYEATYRFVAADQNVSFGATAFYNDYTNPQFFLETVPGNRFSIQVENLDKSRTYGLELDGRAALNEEFSVFGSLGLLETEVTRSSVNPALVGNTIGRDPNITASAGFVWSPANVPGWTLDGKVSYIGEFFNDFNNLATQEIGDYAIVDLGATFKHNGFEGRVFVNNLTDETGVNARVGTLAEVTTPRTFGVSLSKDF
ncbi:MAG: TonB-dependent receptor [Pseudomonadota bacterium]